MVSGLKKYYSIDQLVNQHVTLLTNLKPSKLRGITSEAMVLAASEFGNEKVKTVPQSVVEKLADAIALTASSVVPPVTPKTESENGKEKVDDDNPVNVELVVPPVSSEIGSRLLFYPQGQNAKSINQEVSEPKSVMKSKLWKSIQQHLIVNSDGQVEYKDLDTGEVYYLGNAGESCTVPTIRYGPVS